MTRSDLLTLPPPKKRIFRTIRRTLFGWSIFKLLHPTIRHIRQMSQISQSATNNSVRSMRSNDSECVKNTQSENTDSNDSVPTTTRHCSGHVMTQ